MAADYLETNILGPDSPYLLEKFGIRWYTTHDAALLAYLDDPDRRPSLGPKLTKWFTKFRENPLV
jgi:hypothetical protein